MNRSENIVCFLSSKGGSGKTVTAASLATLLSGLGIKTLLVDTDAATNGMTLLFLEFLLNKKSDRTNVKNRGLFEVDSGNIPTIIDIKENLYFVPAAFRLRNTEETPSQIFEKSLEALLSSSGGFDVVLVDAQAGVDEYAKRAASLSDIHLIVSEYDPVSAQGIDRLKVVFAEELQPERTFTLFNKILPEFAEVIGDGLAIARYLPPISWDADVVRAFARRDLAINIESPNAYTLAISQIALSCLQDIAGDAIETWQGSSLELATGPVKSRLNELKKARSSIINRTTIPKYQIFGTIASIIGLLGTLIILSIQAIRNFKTEYLFDMKIYDILPVAILSVAAIVFGITVSKIEKSSKDHKDKTTALDEEIEILSANLAASESIFQVTARGPYSNIRRKKR